MRYLKEFIHKNKCLSAVQLVTNNVTSHNHYTIELNHESFYYRIIPFGHLSCAHLSFSFSNGFRGTPKNHHPPPLDPDHCQRVSSIILTYRRRI